MLILSREVNESIIIGRDLAIQVVGLTEDKVKLRALRLLIGSGMTEELLVTELSRDEHIELGDGIRCDIVDIRAPIHKVRLGISAPKEMSIHRTEVWRTVRHDPPFDDLIF